VPFFIRWPGGKIEEGRDIHELTAHVDVLPTLMDLCKVERSEGDPPMHGKSIAPLLMNTDTPWPDRAIVVDSQRMELMQKYKNFSVMRGPWRFVNRTELYDISSDPGQKTNVIDEHSEVAARLGEEYEKYWQLIEPMNSTYVRIVLGHDAENPARLTAHDWHTDNEPVPWHQRHVRGALEANGFWAVDVARAGQYRIELRRWPRDELDLPIHAALPDEPWVTDNRLNRPGLAIKPVKARLTIGDIDETVDVTATDKAAVFEVDLEAGPTKLQTWFIDADGTERGAYYCYIERSLGVKQ
jgi:arylsulfatase B